MATVAPTVGGNAAFTNYANLVNATAENGEALTALERRRLVLDTIDNQEFGMTQLRSILVAGVGFFTDAYDIFAINLCSPLIALAFFPGGKMPYQADIAIKLATSIGTIIGQLGFGWGADLLGRRACYAAALIVVIISTLGLCLSGGGPGVSVVAAVVFWRIIMGIGIGGDYPLSSIITSEFATTKWRGASVAAVFANQGHGQLVAALVALVATVGFKSQLSSVQSLQECSDTPSCRKAADSIWRIIVAFGAVPGVCALYYRLTMPETPRYQLDVADAEAAAAKPQPAKSEASSSTQSPEGSQNGRVDEREQDQPETASRTSWSAFFSHYSHWRYGKILLGCSFSWFTLDVAFYGLGLNNSLILASIGFSASPLPYKTLFNNALGNLILVLAGALPGYYTSIALLDTVGRWPVQMGGFIILSILFTIIGFAWDKLGQTALLALYVLNMFFFNCGPNTTTFVIPAECFPTAHRSRSHGISAAAGKLGAVFAMCLIGPLRVIGHVEGGPDSPWMNNVMKIFAGFMALGIVSTLLVPETKRQSLEVLAGRLHDEKAPGEELRQIGDAN